MLLWILRFLCYYLLCQIKLLKVCCHKGLTWPTPWSASVWTWRDRAAMSSLSWAPLDRDLIAVPSGMNATTKGIFLRHRGRCLPWVTNPKTTYSNTVSWSTHLSQTHHASMLCKPTGEHCSMLRSGPWLPDFNYTVCLAERQRINPVCLTSCNTQTSTASSPLARPAEVPRFYFSCWSTDWSVHKGLMQLCSYMPDHMS